MFKYLTTLLLLLSICQAPAFAQVDNLSKVRIANYEGGQNSNDYGDKIAANQGTSLINTVIQNKGQVYTRGGQALFNVDTQTAAFNGVSRYDPTSSLSYVMAASGVSVISSLSSGTSWTVVNTGHNLTAGLSTNFIQANNLFFVMNGSNPTSWWDNSTWTVGGTWPGSVSPPTATTAAWLNNYLFLAGNSTNPDWVYVSDALSPQSFQANQVIKIQSGDGQPIVKLEPYRTGDILIYKARSIYDLNIANVDSTCSPQPICQWSYSVLVKDVGTPAPRSVVSLGNDQWFLSSQPFGVRSVTRSQFDKSFVNLISQPIQDIFDGTADRHLNTVQVAKAAGVYFDNKYLLAIPTGSSTVNDLVLVYDFLSQAWYIIDGWYPQSWVVFNNNLYYADANDGRVVQCFTGTTGDVGTVVPFPVSGPSVGIAFSYTSKIIDFDNPENFKQMDSIGLEFAPSGVYNATIEINLDNSGWQTAGMIPLTANAVTLPVTLPFVLSSPGITYRTLQLSQYGEFKKMQVRVSLGVVSEQIFLQKITLFARLKPWRRE